MKVGDYNKFKEMKKRIKNSECCANCKFYNIDYWLVYKGRCIYNPPQAVVFPSGVGNFVGSEFPEVSYDALCGRFTLSIDDE